MTLNRDFPIESVISRWCQPNDNVPRYNAKPTITEHLTSIKVNDKRSF